MLSDAEYVGVTENKRGQQTSANSQPVVFSNDQTSIPVTVSGISVIEDVNVAKVGGTVQTGRDWSPDLAKLQSLPVNPRKEDGHGSSIGTPTHFTDDAANFWRIKNKRFLASEEVRYDIPLTLTSADIYTGVAPDGTLTSAASWTIIRTYFDVNAQPNRERIRVNVVWDNRTSGWS